MNQQPAQLKAFQIIGIKTRTCNADEMKGAQKIANLWGQFYDDGFEARIPHRLDNDIVAVYHDFESDVDGKYSLIVGARVVPGTKAPAGFEILNVPAQEYVRFTSDKGQIPGIIFKVWQNIWGLAKAGAFKRKYSYDVEIYGEDAIDQTNAQINVYVSVK